MKEKSRIVNFRVSNKFLKEIKAAAKKNDLTMSAFIKSLLMREINK